MNVSAMAKLAVTSFLLTSISAQDNVMAQPELSDPVPLLVGGEQLDVQLNGAAAPWVYDIDNDGRRDLLVGEAFRGRLRLYRNMGTNESPIFEGFQLFKDGSPEGCVPKYNGFCPQLADLDGDGHDDIITPAHFGQVRWFRSNQFDFLAGQPIQGVDGKEIRMAWTIGVSAVDWDADFDVDLVVGTSGGEGESIHLLRNESKAGRVQFADPIPIRAAGKDIRIPKAAPTIADWDSDGRFDLLVGCGDGSVIWYRNQGIRGKPRFGKSQRLHHPVGGKTGTQAKVCVVDWNEDGKLDLLLGDLGDRFEKTALSGVELQQRDHLEQQQHQAFEDWSRMFRTYRKLRQRTSDDAEERSRRMLGTSRRELMRLKKIQNVVQFQLQAYKTGRHYHGRVWVLLGS